MWLDSDYDPPRPQIGRLGRLPTPHCYVLESRRMRKGESPVIRKISLSSRPPHGSEAEKHFFGNDYQTRSLFEVDILTLLK